VAGRILPIPVYRRQPAHAIILAILALCLRLVLPAAIPAIPANGVPLDLVAAFGEHALCIAAAEADRDAAAPQTPAPQHDGHSGHECPGCCSSVVALGAGLLPRALAIRIRFAPVTLAAVAEEPPPLSSYRIRPAEPRGPPALG
jgi:hypothetical protein